MNIRQRIAFNRSLHTVKESSVKITTNTGFEMILHNRPRQIAANIAKLKELGELVLVSTPFLYY